jgi:chromosome transmission fidelity protein 1
MIRLHKSSVVDEDAEPICTKIFYASRYEYLNSIRRPNAKPPDRTHSQLTQVLPEMRRLKLDSSVSSEASAETATRLGKRPADAEDLMTPSSIRSVALGSRKQLCIHDPLRKRSSDLDEACRQLLGGWSLVKPCCVIYQSRPRKGRQTLSSSTSD